MDWATVLVSSFGAIVVRCDGRGSGFQGTNLLHRIQKRPGVFEEQDQRDALKYGTLQASSSTGKQNVVQTQTSLSSSFILKEPYVDKSRVGAFGQVRTFCRTVFLCSPKEQNK